MELGGGPCSERLSLCTSTCSPVLLCPVGAKIRVHVRPPAPCKLSSYYVFLSLSPFLCLFCSRPDIEKSFLAVSFGWNVHLWHQSFLCMHRLARSVNNGNSINTHLVCQDHKPPDLALTPFSSLNTGISTTCSSVSFICKMETLIPPYLPYPISLRLKWNMIVKELWRQRNVFIRSNSILEGLHKGKGGKTGTSQ